MPKTFDMAEEILTQIPGYEAGRVHRVNADDEIGASFIIAKMVSDLRTRWNTSVAVLSLDGHKDAIEAIVPADGSIVKTLILDQKNPDINVIERKLRGLIHRQFIRAAIISPSGALKGSPDFVARTLDRIATYEKIPVILVNYPNI